MTEEPQTSVTTWPVVRDWLQIFGAARMALHPTKLALALAALLLTFAWGAILDGVWKVSGLGVDRMAIARFADPESAAGAELFAAAIRSAPPGGSVATGGEAAAEYGICELWRQYSVSAVEGMLYGAGTLNFVGPWPGSVQKSVGLLCLSTRWMVSEHFFFAILLMLGTLAIWALFGGAISRIAAVQFARDRKIGIGEAIRFAGDKFLSGFFISPLLPVLIMLAIALLLAIGGAFLAIPYFGDVFLSLPFFLALLGGLAIACVSIGCVGGGSFFWPTVAVEGSDGFDAISRSFSYFFGRPVRTIVYGLTALVWGGICWWVLKFVLCLTLRITHACVSCGVGGFCTGWWGVREGAGEGLTKLDALWQDPMMSDLYRMGERSQMGGFDIFATVVIGIWVLLAIGLLWAFLASFYFSGSTIIYFLLRREVDATDFEDVYEENEEPYEQEAPPVAVSSDAPPPAAPLGDAPPPVTLLSDAPPPVEEQDAASPVDAPPEDAPPEDAPPADASPPESAPPTEEPDDNK